MLEKAEMISSIQKSIWIKQNLYADSALFNVGGYLELNGRVDLDLLFKAYELIFKNYDSINLIRSALKYSGTPKFYNYSFMDMSAEGNPKEACLDWMCRDMKTKINMDTMLINIVVLKASDTHHYVYHIAHHIIIDAFGFELLTRKVSDIYQNLKNNISVEGHETIFKFADYLQDVHDYENSVHYTSDKLFWYEKLKNIEWNRGFGSYITSKQSNSLAALRKELVVKRQEFDQINRFCIENNCTVFHYMISVVLILNDRSNNGSFIMGLPVFNRGTKRYKNTLGVFINILPFCIEIEETDTIISILEKVKAETKNCYRHQKFPIIDLHDELNLSRGYFNTLFSYQKINHETDLYGIKSKSVYLNCGEQEEDLIFHLIEYSEHEDLTLAFDYKAESFSEQAIDALIKNFIELTSKLYAMEHKLIKEISILSEDERLEILSFSNKVSEYPGNKTFIDLFEMQVEKTPDNTAVVFNEIHLSYTELNTITNQLAAYLNEKFEIKPDDLIAIKLERSEWMLISIIAILKSGAAYIPIETTYPKERTDYILKNANCKLLLDEEQLFRFKMVGDNYPKSNPGKGVLPGNLAYVIYTSGSTGAPKGSMIEHKGMLNHLLAMKNELNLEENRIIAQSASYTFDISVWQLLNALIVGGTTVIFDEHTILSPEIFINQIKNLKISIVQVVPSYLRSMLDFFEPENVLDLDSLKYLSVTGEAVTQQLLEKWFEMFPGIKVVNAYGPAEASDDITLHIMDKAPQKTNVSVGKPIQNVQVYILDKNEKFCPIGLEGEIFVSGIAVGRGYIGDLDKTRENFMTDPFVKEEHIRMYRTGDMGKWLHDGTIEYLGRKDDQVKIRGFRIELGEIEYALCSHPSVHECVVVSVQGINDEKYLTAYFVGDLTVEVEDIKLYLKEKLPAYMLPSFMIRLGKLPLNKNGKVDKKLLPDPESASVKGSTDYVVPRNAIEEKLADIWSEVLNIENPGVKTSFFDMGGHSLKAIQIISRIYTAFGVKVEMSLFFQQTNIESLAKYIEAVNIVVPEDNKCNQELFL